MRTISGVTGDPICGHSAHPYAGGMSANRERLDELLRQRRRNSRVPTVVAAWAKIGVSVSPLSAQRQTDFVGLLRTAGFRAFPTLQLLSPEPLFRAIVEFAGLADILAITGWEVEEEPAVLLPAEALNRSISHLRSIYPDGFVLIDQPTTSALVVDFDEDDRSAVYLDKLSLGGG
jgi:hypothetical protein